MLRIATAALARSRRPSLRSLAPTSVVMVSGGTKRDAIAPSGLGGGLRHKGVAAPKPSNNVLAEYGVTVFEEMSRLAAQHNAVNLGQGFPDVDGPEDIREVAAQALVRGPNQYPPMLGVPELRKAVAAHEERFYGLPTDWQTETIVGSGATEMLASALFALINPGDEVVLIEPLYDSYLPIIRRAGGVPRLVTITPDNGWQLDMEELAAAFNDKTKLLLLNNPQNPAGKAYTRAELEDIAALVQQHDCYALCDEVYEHLVFEQEHIPLMTLPGMRDRCIKIGSAGKTFSLTGWKVGYATASPNLMQPVSKAHQYLTFTTPPNLQKAVAFGLNKDASYYTGLMAEMREKRDHLRAGLETSALTVIPCTATYFLVADIRSVSLGETDVQFAQRLVREAGVAVVPMSGFYQPGPSQPQHLIRFCFAKQESVLQEAIDRLTNYLPSTL